MYYLKLYRGDKKTSIYPISNDKDKRAEEITRIDLIFSDRSIKRFEQVK